MARPSAREVAVEALNRWRRSKEFADAILARARAGISEESERAFAQELFYGVLRHLTLLDGWIAHLRQDHLDDATRDLLRLGLYQILFLGTPAHAAVHETVALAPTKTRGVVNGILRRALRKEDSLRAWAKAAPLSVRESHPEFLVARWQKNLGKEHAEALCRWNNEPPLLYARVNSLRVSAKVFQETNPTAEPITDRPGFFRCARLPSESIGRGDCYIQDPSTDLAVSLLQVRGGERVLDACAAPGGKASYLAALTQNEAHLVACDSAPERVERLRQNLARLGAEAEIFQHDWMTRPEPSLQPFDKILVDAPCSNTGVMRRRVDVRWRLRPEDFLIVQDRQRRILREVAPLLLPGGRLVYSTCSLEPEENEDVVNEFVKEHPEFAAIEIKSVLPFRDGFDGAFAAVLHRRGPMES